MKDLDNDKIIEFENSDRFVDPIAVKRFVSETSTKQIGRVYQEVNSKAIEPILYTCHDMRGNEIAEPTTDWLKVQEIFEKYGKELAEKELETLHIKLTKKESEIKKIRDRLSYKGKDQTRER